MQKRLLLVIGSVLFSACSFILYEEDDVHYMQSCQGIECTHLLAQFKTQCLQEQKGEIIEQVEKSSYVGLQCRPPKKAEEKK
ncbi:hypothetical protein [Pelistega ratti]|uniref:hypothetical protein n=1 Tax=Pelistega ratti TaxID=2652177 RepID=UPI001359326D|nr:hypothetical protein [Pelistega ratti]